MPASFSPAIGLAVFAYVFQGLQGLKFVSLNVPGAVIMGQAVWIICGYDLEGETLYSVKWYKNNVEFYRFLPNDRPFGQTYDMLGVHLSLNQSNETHVLLWKTDLNTEGVYACEVSTEGPFYRTIKADKEMRIYVLPEEGPVIEGVQKRYQIGEEVNVTCKSGPSKPPAYLKWYINEQEAPDMMETEYPAVRHFDGLQLSEVRLSFVVDEGHFWSGVMKLRCTASISQIYSRSSEELIVGDRSSGVLPHVIPRVTPGQEGPTINGGLPKYDVGDVVDVNCTSARTGRAAVLRWFINGQAPDPNYLVHSPIMRFLDGTETSSLTLRFRVHRHHFRSNEMRLKCTATLSKVISMSSEETVIGSSQQSSGLHVLEDPGAFPSCSSTQEALMFIILICLIVLIT